MGGGRTHWRCAWGRSGAMCGNRRQPRGAGRALSQRERADEAACEGVGGTEPPPGGLAPEVLAQARAELAHAGGTHPWRKVWSVKQLREQHAGQAQVASTALAA